MYITLQEARKHLNLDDYFHEDDSYILELIKVSEAIVAKRIDRKLFDCIDPSTGELEPEVAHAVKLLIGTYYNQREATTPQNVKEVPLAFEYLADLNRRYTIL